MDQRRSRPRSRGHGGPKTQDLALSVKVFNCIVDETSLIQGAKRSTRDGIPKWVAAGRMRLFVPLYALTQASRVKSAKGRAASDAGEALEWLDDATTTYPQSIALQGGYDKFETWEEVEKYALPKALFSEDDVVDSTGMDDIRLRTEQMTVDRSQAAARGSTSSNDSTLSAFSNASARSQGSASPLSPPTSPPKVNIALEGGHTPGTTDKGNRNSGELQRKHNDLACTPKSMQPLFNYILWRVHQETDPTAALDSFIFLTDNSSMKKHAQRFGIRSKTLTEFRYVIAREIQDERNRQVAQHKGQQSHVAGKKSTSSVSSGRTPLVDSEAQSNARSPRPITPENDRSVSDDDDEILLKRGHRSAPLPTGSPKAQKLVIDPDQFHRGPPRGGSVEARGSSRGSPRSTNARGRGGSRGRGRGGGRGQAAQPAEPIDPDSFARPTSSRGTSRGGRGLWIPT